MTQSPKQPTSGVDEKALPSVIWEYVGDELALFWTNPYDGRKEKIATFWWPCHPINNTAGVEHFFEAIATRAAMSNTQPVQAELTEAEKAEAVEVITVGFSEIPFPPAHYYEHGRQALSALLERFEIRRKP